MRYNGKIEKLNHIVISDPSYKMGVWCRYECKDLKEKDLFVDIDISRENIQSDEEYFAQGTEFNMLLHKNIDDCILGENGTYKFLDGIDTTEYTIGMDTACIALGINKKAKEIVHSQNDWQPDCSLKTGTDGIFGSVIVGKRGEELSFILINGYLDSDTDYNVKEVLDYLENQFSIVNLTKETAKKETIEELQL